VTVSGRGYQFAGALRSGPQAPQPHPFPTTVPELTLELIGRERELDKLTALVRMHRLVTIVGFGGVGKTQLGCELARLLISEFAGGVQWVDLAAIESAQAARKAVLAITGEVEPRGGLDAPELALTVESPARLLVLDGCERWIGLAAELAESTLRLNRATRVVTTSREPLRVEGESTYRLGPLELPAGDLRDVDAVSRTPAVRMFLARLAASGGAAPAGTTGLRAASVICLALDGIPLAIEMAAVRAVGVGVDWVVAHLDQPMAWLTHGSRTAPKRQHSMQAALEWSFEALSASERWVLKRVSEFSEPFSLVDACKLLEPDGINAADTLDRLSNLVAKCLVERLESSGTVSYKLFCITRSCTKAMPWLRA
jgi:predicted ATPase